MNVLITGGAGFIGSIISEALLQDGNKVIVIDNLSTGSIYNILHLFSNSNFRFIKSSIINTNVLEPEIKNSDFILHLASTVGVEYVNKNSYLTKKVNIYGSYQVFDFASRYKKKILFCSSSEVYNNKTTIPISEKSTNNNSHMDSLNLYGKTKIISEMFLKKLQQKNSLDSIIVRLFNVAGPKQKSNFGMVVPRFIEQAYANEPITVFGDGNQTRSFIHVYDVARIFIKLIRKEEALGKIINVGSDNEISILNLAKKIKAILGSKSEIVRIPYKKSVRGEIKDFKRRVPNTSKLSKIIDINPLLNLDAIVYDTSEYITNNLKINNFKIR